MGKMASNYVVVGDFVCVGDILPPKYSFGLPIQTETVQMII